MWETVPRELSGQKGSRENKALQERSTTIHRTWRKKFLDKLHAAGLHMEKVPRDLTFPCCINRSLAQGQWHRALAPVEQPGLAGSQAGA